MKPSKVDRRIIRDKKFDPSMEVNWGEMKMALKRRTYKLIRTFPSLAGIFLNQFCQHFIPFHRNSDLIDRGIDMLPINNKNQIFEGCGHEKLTSCVEMGIFSGFWENVFGVKSLISATSLTFVSSNPLIVKN